MRYYDYLQTEHWKEIKKKILERDRNKCLDCGEAVRLNVHHLTYRNLGNERDEDLITLCGECHKLYHQEERLFQSRPFVKLFGIPKFKVLAWTAHFCSLLSYLETNTNRLVERKLINHHFINIPLSSDRIQEILSISPSSLWRFLTECERGKFIIKRNNEFIISPVYAFNGRNIPIELYKMFEKDTNAPN